LIGLYRAMPATDILLTGDLILDEPDPDYWLSGIAAPLRAAALTIGHLEVPHTLRGQELAGDVPAPAADPAHLAALGRAGFAALTLGGNHMADCGAEGICDTIAELERLGIAHAGAGRNLEEARRPAWLRAAELDVALLSYNCVGPETSWATAERAGCAYVRIDTADQSRIWPGAALLRPDPASVAEMAADIAAVRRADLVIVALHKGIVHTPALLAPYERPLARAAIDAGADVVVGHHAHILRGVEFYRDRPIYHGLGNGCVVTRALSPVQEHAARAEWAAKRKELFGFEPDPAYTLAPFHPEAVHSILARIRIDANGQLEAGFVPVFVEAPGRPVLADAPRARAVNDYVARITRLAGLPGLRQQAGDGMVWLT
jgi:poly-gamma-glutamate capsule biosynthesis protein CapA/YwtB (metallophosphatase superfamily)